LTISKYERVEINQPLDSVPGLVCNTGYYCPAVTMPNKDNIVEIFIVQHRKYVLDMRCEPYLWSLKELPGFIPPVELE
jgi:hypothetical protein